MMILVHVLWTFINLPSIYSALLKYISLLTIFEFAALYIHKQSLKREYICPNCLFLLIKAELHVIPLHAYKLNLFIQHIKWQVLDFMNLGRL